MKENAMRTTAPTIWPVDEVTIMKPSETVLCNDIPLWYIKGGSQEIVKFELVFSAGSYNQEKPLQAFSATKLLKNGTSKKTAAQINQLWDYYGVSLQIEAQKDLVSVGFFCLARHLDPALDLLFEMIADAVYPQHELELLLKNRRQKHIISMKKVQHIARVHFNELLFGSQHPYGRILTLDDFSSLTREDIMRFNQRFFRPENCFCFVAGRFPDNIFELVNSKIRKYSWLKGDAIYEHREIISNGIREKEKIVIKDAVQSSIRIGKLIAGRRDPDYHRISIANTLLGGYFGSRLMKNIRQEKGYTYGIQSAIVSMLKASWFFITTQVGKQVCDAALEEIYKELKGLKDKPAADDELQLLKNYLSAGFLRSFDGPFMQIERFREILLFDQDYSYYDSFLPLLQKMKAADIQEVAEQHFNADEMTELIAG